MTEYGRGQGSEPWHPEDPLYGDDGWGGQQAQSPQSPYGGQPQHYPQQPQQQNYGDWSDGGQSAYGQGQQQYQGYDQQYYADQGQQQYHQGQQQQNQGQQQYQGQQTYDQDGWSTGSHVQYTDPSDPYGQQASYGGDQPDYYGTPDAYPPPEPPGRRRTEPEPPRTDWDPGPDQGEHAFFAGNITIGDQHDAARKVRFARESHRLFHGG